MDEFKLAKEGLAKRMAGEISLSEKPGKVIRKWRNILKIPQRKVAESMDVMPSVISDYESGRRKSPGIKIIKRMVEGMLSVDQKRGGEVIKEFSNFPQSASITSAVLDIKEFVEPVKVSKFVKSVKGRKAYNFPDKEIYGYTVIDSVKAIVEFSPMDLVKLYGLTTERALVFTNLTRGRSPLIAIKVSNLKPGLVILQGINKVDDIALRIAQVEKIPLVHSSIGSEELLKNLKDSFS